MNYQDTQIIIDKAVKLATRCAMYGNPVKQITWIPPSSPTQDWTGCFAIQYEGPLSGSQLPSWEK